MITIKNMKFGDIVYIVETINNVLRKNKLTFTDAEGNKWYRYDKPNWEYSIKELVYCGKTMYIKEGEVRFDEEDSNRMHFKYPDGQIYSDYEDEIETETHENWFNTNAEAEEFVKMKEKENG